MLNNGVRINWPVRSADMSTTERHFWTEGPTHNSGIKKHPGSQCDVTEGIEADP